MLSSTVFHGSSRGSWNTYPILASPSVRPCTSNVPALGVSIPDTMFRNVLLPHPDGPTSVTNVWPSASKLTSRSANTGSWPARVGGNTFLTSRATSRATPAPPSRTSRPRSRPPLSSGPPRPEVAHDTVHHDAIEREDDDHHHQAPGHHALEAARVVPVVGAPADALVVAEPLDEQHRA